MVQKKAGFLKGRLPSLFIVGVICLSLLLGGYIMYQRSIEDAVEGTTRSFMNQLAEHDIRNVGSQVDGRLNYLRSLNERLELLRRDEQIDISYLLSVEAQSTQFQKIYLITEGGAVYDSAYLETNLDEFGWSDTYEAAEGEFVARFTVDRREEWGEYLLYGIHLDEPVYYADKGIEGIVGLIPVEELDGLVQLESFGGMGTTLVIEQGGEIITASRYYDAEASLNYFRELDQAEFLDGTSIESCKTAVSEGKSIYLEYLFEDVQYSAMLKPMGETSYGNGWYMVVKIPEEVTAGQTRSLLNRSLLFFALLSIVIFAGGAFVFINMRKAEMAEASERAKSTFLANMSHEIRTPLNGITGLLYLMRQNLDDNEKIKVYLEKAEVSAGFLKSVITEVLDMSKIESGQLELYSRKINLDKLLQEIRMLIEPQSEEHGQNFAIDCKDLSRPWVIGDEVRMKQIIVNLLGNALKFTPPGGNITLTVRQTVRGETADTILIITDTGCGMSGEFLEKIWNPFEQEHRFESQNGTGLGTTLSKMLVEKMGGTIKVESRIDEGTTFTIRIPFAIAPEETVRIKPEPESRISLAGLRILAAEDNDINREILIEILGGYGASVTAAVNGQEAVELFSQSKPFTFDVVLMDIQMPVLDGYGASKAIRALVRPDSASVPIFALTANAFKEEADRARESGMNDVITKPLDVAVLLGKLSGASSGRND